MSEAPNDTTNLGDLILLAEGEYEDYSVIGVALAIKRFNPLDERDRFLQTLDLEDRYRNFDQKTFVQWLVEEKLIICRNDVQHLQLGGFYGDASEVTYNGHHRDLNLP